MLAGNRKFRGPDFLLVFIQESEAKTGTEELIFGYPYRGCRERTITNLKVHEARGDCLSPIVRFEFKFHL
nr:MAG TPA: hypothetical protein [Caudoviricetes sp.]